MLNEIKLSKFLVRYCNLAGKDLTKIRHEDVKILFPSLKRASFELLEKKPELLLNGQVLLVNDGHKVIPYYVPNLKEEDLKEPMTFTRQEDEKPKVDYHKYDYTKMSIYELKCLLKRKFNSYANRRNARKELEKRGAILTKKYCRPEEKRKVEKVKNERY